MAIRITRKDREKLARLNKSAKRKDYRLRSQFGVDVAPPIRKIDTFTSRKELNTYIKNVENFTDRKNFRYVKQNDNPYRETNVFPREVVQEYKQAIKLYNKSREKRRQELSNIDFRSGGKSINISALERSKMGDARFEDLRDKSVLVNSFRSQDALVSEIGRLRKRATQSTKKQDAQLFKNYKKAVENVFGDSELSAEIYSKLKQLGTKDFVRGYYGEEFLSLDYVYTFQEVMFKHVNIVETLDNLIKEKKSRKKR